MNTYLICATLYFIAFSAESSTPTWLRVLTAVCLVTLCAEAIFDQYRIEKRIKTLEEKLNDIPKNND
nr:MAG TPA: Potassium voltage-gated channel subfamily KQT, Atrial fibrillation, Cell membrane.7A [Caudoviricetes sp.]